jgi:3-oxoacyl-[acyl-carrier-protein] synthase-3
MNDIRIQSIGYYIPDGRITNEEILKKVKSANEKRLNQEDLDLVLYSCGRKFDFLGIKSRSFSNNLQEDNFTSMAVKAGKKAIALSGQGAENIDAVVLSGISNPYREPSGACIVAKMLGLSGVDHFDINDTCNGFLKAIEIAGLYILNKGYRKVLVVTAECPGELEQGLGLSLAIDSADEIDNRLSGLIIGAGAAAAIIEPGEGKRTILRYRNGKESEHWDSSLIRIPHTIMPPTKYGRSIDGFWADARGMSAELIKGSPSFVIDCLDAWKIDMLSIKHLLLHQLGNNITFAILDKLALPHEIAPINTFSEFGNMGTVNIPVNFAIAEERGIFKKDELILLLNSACGFTYSCALIKW